MNFPRLVGRLYYALIYMSANSDVTQTSRPRTFNQTEFIEKPFTPEDLIRRAMLTEVLYR